MMGGSFLVLFYNNNKLKYKIYQMNANRLISNNEHTKNEQLFGKRIRRMKRNIWTSTFNHFLNIKIQTEDDEEDYDDNEHQKRLNNWITYTPATRIVIKGFLVPFLLHWNWAKSANWWSANWIETTTTTTRTRNRYNNRTTNNEWWLFLLLNFDWFDYKICLFIICTTKKQLKFIDPNENKWSSSKNSKSTHRPMLVIVLLSFKNSFFYYKMTNGKTKKIKIK